MNIVLDTNVLVSGLLSSRGPPAAIFDAVYAGHLRLCFDGRILAEYREVLARKKLALDKAYVENLIARFEARGRLVPVPPIRVNLPDPDDNIFVEVAIASRADYLITGNLKDYPAEAVMGVVVISPREFVDRMRYNGEDFPREP